ncbi:MAG: DUF5011 domain-containing protein, partial [Aestuariibacter sp.]|nr:DUF5011 domain-containing protein [Aestuariibacter sp.]
QVTRSVNVTPDVTLPVISLAGVSPISIELGTPYTDAGTSASDNIDGDLTANIATVSNVNVNVVGSYSVTYNVSDAAGNAALQVTRSVNVTPDVTVPVISLVGPSPINIELGTPYTDAGASAYDNIDGDITANIATVSNVNVDAVGSYSITYNVIDASGNPASQAIRTVNVTPDATLPAISLAGVSPVNIELGTPYTDAGASASDNIDGDLTANIATVSNVNVNAVGSYSVTYNVSDATGNAALQVTRTVNVTPDVTLPVISLAGASPVDIELGTSYVDAGASADDNIDGDLTTNIATVSNVNVNAVGSYSVTYNVTDSAGNAALQVTRSVNVTPDVTLPAVTAPASIIVAATDANGSVATNATIATFLGGANANDSVDGPVAVTNDAPAVFPLGVTTVTFSASDNAGNTGTVQATVTIQDQTAPLISLLGASSITLEVGGIFTDPGSNVSDNVDTGLTATVSGSVNTGAIGLYSLSYNVSDAAGNAAVQVIRSIGVQDSLSPVVTVPGNIIIAATDINGTAATSATIVAFLAGASAIDAAEGAVAVTNDAPAIFAPGVTTVTFSAMDTAGNFGMAQATVTVTDQGLPVISLAGVSPINIELGTPYTDAGASASDNIDGDLTTSIATVSNVNVNAVGSYSITYNVSDAAGNAALQVTRTVNVTPDVTLPVISLAGVNPINIELGTPYVDAGASASDNIDGDLTTNIATNSNVNVNAVGSYSVTYNVSDGAGNAAAQVTRSVNVTPDITRPVIS